MAVQTSAKVASGIQPRADIYTDTVYGTIEATALSTNDTVEMVKLPKGATIIDAIMATDDLDTNATPTLVLDLMLKTDGQVLISGSTIGQGGGVARLDQVNAVGKTLTADDTVQVKATTGAATGATGTINVAVIYTMQG